MRDPIPALLDAAAAAGRSSPPPLDELARYGHWPVAPMARCQVCGRWLELRTDDHGGAGWAHLRPDGPDEPA